MATWPTNPDWTDISNINAGNEYVAADGLTEGAMNAIVKNLEYLKNTTGSMNALACKTAFVYTNDPAAGTQFNSRVTNFNVTPKENDYVLNVWKNASTDDVFIISAEVVGVEDTTVILSVHVAEKITGPQGSTGAQGPAGQDGAQGPKGDNGIGFGDATQITLPYGSPTVTYDTEDGLTVSGTFRIVAASNNYDIPFQMSVPILPGKGINIDANEANNAIVISAKGYVETYSINVTTSNVTAAPDNPTEIKENETVTLKFTVPTGYQWAAPTVTGATYTVQGTNIILSNPTDNVTVTARATAIEYSINIKTTNVLASAVNPSKIAYGSTATLYFSPYSGYERPDEITISGAEYTWNKDTGTLVLSDPTGNVTGSIVGVQTLFNITETSLVGCTPDQSNPTNINKGGTATLLYYPETGYQLPADVTVTGATYTWEKTAGTGMLDLSNPTANVSITITATQLPQLATPTNVAISGTTVSWDAVENAESYDIYVDNTLYENTTGGVISGETWVLNETLSGTLNKTTINFTSNSQSFTGLDYKNFSADYYLASGDYVNTYNVVQWENEAYRTITFDEPVTDTSLLAWLQANGTKQ